MALLIGDYLSILGKSLIDRRVCVNKQKKTLIDRTPLARSLCHGTGIGEFYIRGAGDYQLVLASKNGLTRFALLLETV